MPSAVDPQTTATAEDAYAARHLRFGLWSLVIYASIGLGLEGLHAFKMQTYLSASTETRRLMWTLGHAHGTLLGLINLAIGTALRSGALAGRRAPGIWYLLVAATVGLPLGFFLGGVNFYSGDPGIGAALIPFGAAALIAALALAATGVRPNQPPPSTAVRRSASREGGAGHYRG